MINKKIGEICISIFVAKSDFKVEYIFEINSNEINHLSNNLRFEHGNSN